MGPRHDLEAIARHLSANRGLRVGLIGTAFVLVGLMLGAGSVWTVPALVLGSVLILAGALGTRFSGRIALDWGESGATIEMRARIAPPAPSSAEQLEPETGKGDQGTPAEAKVIEASGETIETDLIELRRVLPAEKSGSGERSGA